MSISHLFSALQRLLGADNPPNKVLEIKSESLGLLQILARDEAMVLYAPPFNSKDKNLYEIVLQRPHTDSNTTSFSLFRSPSQQEAEDKFNAFLHRLPLFVTIVKEVSDLSLQYCFFYTITICAYIFVVIF